MLSDDLQPFAETAGRFARDVLARCGATLDAAAGPALDRVLAEAAELGLLSLCAPADSGGLDQEVDALCAVLRPIARADAGIAAAVLVQAGAHHLLRGAGAWPEGLLASELVTWPAFAELGGEPELRLSADGGRASGQLSLVPLAARARHLVATARGAGAGRALACCRLPAGGAARTDAVVLGLHGCAPADLRLVDVAVAWSRSGVDPGAPDIGAWVSLGVAAIALGILEGSLATALDYARQRRQGGRLIIEWPEVRRMLAALREAASVIDAALAGVLARRRRGDPTWAGDAIALGLRATDSARAGTTDGVQLLGGNGYMKEYPQERRMRDARQLRCMLGSTARRSARAFDDWLAHAG